jgi:hypothetical protein
MQLRFSGRFSVTQATWSSNSTRTFFPPGTFSVEGFSLEVLADILIPSHLRRRTRRGIADGYWIFMDRVGWSGKGSESLPEPTLPDLTACTIYA